jgi:hypothetical protein
MNFDAVPPDADEPSISLLSIAVPPVGLPKIFEIIFIISITLKIPQTQYYQSNSLSSLGNFYRLWGGIGVVYWYLTTNYYSQQAYFTYFTPIYSLKKQNQFYRVT